MVESSRNGLLANWDHQRVLLTLSSRVSCLWRSVGGWREARYGQFVFVFFCRLCDIHGDTWTLKLYRPMFSSSGRSRISWRGAENRAQLKSFKATPVSLVIRIIMIMIQQSTCPWCPWWSGLSWSWFNISLTNLSTIFRLRSRVSPSSKS